MRRQLSECISRSFRQFKCTLGSSRLGALCLPTRSVHSDVDEVNKELAEFFGNPCPAGPSSDDASAAPGTIGVMGSSQAGSSSSSSSSSSSTSSNLSSAAAAASLASSQARPGVVPEPQQLLDEPPAALEQLQQCTVQLQEQVRAVSRLLQEVAQDQQQQQQQQVPLRRQQRQLAWHHQPQHHALPQGQQQQQQQQQLRINVPADHAVFISSQPATPPAEVPKPAPFQQQQQQQHPLQAPPAAATAPNSAPPSPGSQPDTAEAAAAAAAGEQPVDAAQQLTHVDGSGRASMVDVGGKPPSSRTATASCLVLLGRPAFDLVKANALAKGDVLSIAQIAGIQGAKQTSSLIPLCHNILLSKVAVQLSLVEEAAAVAITATAKCVGQTGVEMEALTAAGVAALTVYDMCKAVSKDIEITALRLDAKEGGKSGSWLRPSSSSAGSSSGSGGSSSGSSGSS